MNKNRTLLKGLAGLLLTGSILNPFTALYAGAVTTPTSKGIKIIYTSDIHGKEEENISMSGNLKTYVEAERKLGYKVVLIDGGDLFTSTDNSEAIKHKINDDNMDRIIPKINDLKYDYLIPGNHEFIVYGQRTEDDSIVGKKSNIFENSILYNAFRRSSGSVINSSTKILSTNVEFLKSSTRGAKLFDDQGVTSAIIDDNGMKVGLLGFTTSRSRGVNVKTGASWPRNAARDLNFNVDPMTFAINEKIVADEIRKLQGKGVTKIIAIAHLEEDTSKSIKVQELSSLKNIATKLSIDVIINGHKHSKNTTGGSPTGTSNTFLQLGGAGLQHIAEIDINVNGNGRIDLKTFNKSELATAMSGAQVEIKRQEEEIKKQEEEKKRKEEEAKKKPKPGDLGISTTIGLSNTTPIDNKPTEPSSDSTGYVDLSDRSNNYSSSYSSGYSSWSGGSSGSSSSGSSGGGGGSSRSSSNGSSNSSSSSSVATVVPSIPTTTYALASSKALIDVKKAFAAVANVKENENKAVEFKSADSIWHFETKDLVKDQTKWGNFKPDFVVTNVEQSKALPQDISSTLKNQRSTVVTFDPSADLPGMAKVSIKLDDTYKNKNVCVYYVHNNGKSGALQQLANGIKVGDNGFLNFNINRGCSFVVIEKSIADSLQPIISKMLITPAPVPTPTPTPRVA